MVVGLVLGWRGQGLTAIGFGAPDSWWATAAQALVLGLGLQLIAVVLVEALAERLTGGAARSLRGGGREGDLEGLRGVDAARVARRGAVLGWVFVASDSNVWLAVLTHGFVDPIGIALVASGADERLRRQFG